MVLQTMIFILPLSGKKMTALPRQEDVDVAEAHTEVATVVTVASIIMGNVEDIEEATMAVIVEGIEEATMAVIVEDIEEATMVVIVEDIEEATMVVIVEDIEEATMAVTVEDTEEVIVEDTVEVTAEAIEAASEASEVESVVESVVAIVAAAMANGGVITMESVDEVEEPADEVIEQVVMDRLKILQLLQFLHDCLTAQHYLPQNSRTLTIYLIYSRSFLMILYCVNIVLHRYPVSSLFFLTIKY